MTVKGFKKHLFIILGSISLAMGITGILLPVLPTTPFLLLTAFLYLRSSTRLYEWIMNHRIFGAYIRNYITYRAIPKRVKVAALVFLWATLAVSMMLVNVMAVRIILPAIGIGVSAHLLKMKTLKAQELEKTKAEPEDCGGERCDGSDYNIKI